MGGCLLTDTVEWGATLPVILGSPPDPATVGPEWRRIWQERLVGCEFPLDSSGSATGSGSDTGSGSCPSNV